jgi:NADH dehydrogenase
VKLSESAHRQLSSLGVDIVTSDPVTACSFDGLSLKSGARIESATIVWGAGVMASPAAKWLKSPADKAGRVIVSAGLTLPDHRNVFVIGDTASVTDAAGRLVPGVAPAAKQMGKFAAKAILADMVGRTVPPFVYKDYGNLATIGRKAAVADFGRLKLTGFPAWLVWGLVHIGFLIGFRNRFTVMLDWFWSYVTYSRGARLITGGK